MDRDEIIQALSAIEREQKVWEVTQQFARDEISIEKFEEEERKYTPDYESAMFAIGRSRQGKLPLGTIKLS